MASWGGGGGLEREEITFDDRRRRRSLRPLVLRSMRVASALHWDQANETKEPQKQRTRCRHKEPALRPKGLIKTVIA